MNSLPHDEPKPGAPIDDIAVYWFTRRRSGAMTPHEQRTLEGWLESDPAHQIAFDAVSHTWGGIESIRSDPRIMALREAVEVRRRRVSTWRAGAIAATLLVTVAAGGGFFANRYILPHGVLATQEFRTGVGEKATVTLSDGSVVTLGTNTRLRTQADQNRRLVYLDRGQAFFEVAKGRSHPFVVQAAGRTVTAVGTAFEVRVDSGFKVVLVEGKVRVATAPGAVAPPASSPGDAKTPPPTAAATLDETVLVAGTQLVATDTQQWSVARTDVARETAWVHGQLVYVDEPLGNVAAEMNRYSDRKIVIADRRAAAIPISGTFRAGDVEAFVSAVEDYDLVRVSSNTPMTVRLASAQ